MTDLNLPELDQKLDVLIRLVAIGVCGDRTQREKIGMLGMAGLSPKTIADILGTTSNTVSVALSNLRKEKKGRRNWGSEGANRE